MLGEYQIAAVGAERAIGFRENWPAAPGEPIPEPSPEDREGTPLEAVESKTKFKRPAANKQVSELVSLLNPKLQRELRLSGKSITDGMIGWHGAIRRELQLLREQLEANSFAASIADYAEKLLHRGGLRKKKLAKRTPQTLISRFAERLCEAIGDAQLLSMDADEIEFCYLCVVLQTPLKSRRQALSAMQGFHHFLVANKGAPSISWTLLRLAAGDRTRDADVGVLWDREIRLVYDQLDKDATDLSDDSGIDAREHRIRQLRRIFYLLLEASGLRPASIHGLTFGDIFLRPDGDWVLVRSTGRYGSAKTSTSRGFVPLEGGLWKEMRATVESWLASERERLGNQFSTELPLFGGLDVPTVREDRDRILSRVGELLRWATGMKRAKPYWLRKTRILRRHQALHQEGSQPSALAVQRILAISGHAHILIPLASYLHDAAIHVARHARVDPDVARDRMLALSGWETRRLDEAWKRLAGGKSVRELDPYQRFSVVISRVNPAQEPSPLSVRSSPPVCKSTYGQTRLSEISEIMRQLADGATSSQAARHIGAADALGASVQRALAEFNVRTGISIGSVRRERTIRPPRNMASAKNLQALFDASARDPVVSAVAESWVTMAARTSIVLGVPVPIDTDRNRLTRWLDSLQIRWIETKDDRGLPVIRPMRSRNTSTAPEKKSKSSAKKRDGSLWPALSWALLCTWVGDRVISSKM